LLLAATVQSFVHIPLGISDRNKTILVTVPFCWRVLLCNAQARTVNLLQAIHLSTINTNSDLSFATIKKQTYRIKQSMDQSDDKLAHGTTDEKELK